MHILGFGTIFVEKSLFTGGNYPGTNGVQAYRFLTNNNNAQTVPYTDESGHWPEEALGTEIMMPRVSELIRIAENRVGLVAPVFDDCDKQIGATLTLFLH